MCRAGCAFKDWFRFQGLVAVPAKYGGRDDTIFATILREDRLVGPPFKVQSVPTTYCVDLRRTHSSYSTIFIYEKVVRMAAFIGIEPVTMRNDEFLNCYSKTEFPAQATPLTRKHAECQSLGGNSGVAHPMLSGQPETAHRGCLLTRHSHMDSGKKKQNHKASEARKSIISSLHHNPPPHDVISISSSDEETKERKRRRKKARKEAKRRVKEEKRQATRISDIPSTLVSNRTTSPRQEQETQNKKRKSEENLGREVAQGTESKKKQKHNHEKQRDKVDGGVIQSSSPLLSVRMSPCSTHLPVLDPTMETKPQESFLLMPTPLKTSGIVDVHTEGFITEPPLCQEQADLVELVMSGRNVFYTGSAGCGKSTVLKAVVQRLKRDGKKVYVIAPTGRAALAVNGITTWTYAGWTPEHHKRPIKKLEEAAAFGRFVRRRLQNTDVLVIDEISMVENHHFERINRILKAARDDNRPFGGVQLIVTGDFCQLPPVKPFQHCMECGKELQKPNKNWIISTCPIHGDFRDIDKWAFRSSAWQECMFQHVNLTSIHRQSDQLFIAILQKCRLGSTLNESDRDILLNHDSETTNAVKLFATRAEVSRVNQTEFNKLTSPKTMFRCEDVFEWNERHGNLKWKGDRNEYDNTLKALEDHRFDPRVELREGMLVVLLINLDLGAGLVNGSQGIISGFIPFEKAVPPQPMNSGGREKSLVAGDLPKQTGDHAETKQAQVRAFAETISAKQWPIVSFDNGVTRHIYPDCTINELGDDPPYSLLCVARRSH